MPSPNNPPSFYNHLCTEEELRAACDRWLMQARTLLDEIKIAPRTYKARRFFLRFLRACHAKLVGKSGLGFFGYMRAAAVEKMIKNMVRSIPEESARGLYLVACQAIELASQDPRQAMQTFLPLAIRVRDQAKYHMETEEWLRTGEAPQGNGQH